MAYAALSRPYESAHYVCGCFILICVTHSVQDVETQEFAYTEGSKSLRKVFCTGVRYLSRMMHQLLLNYDVILTSKTGNSVLLHLNTLIAGFCFKTYFQLNPKVFIR